MVADNPDEKIKLKMFHSEIQNDTGKLNQQLKRFRPVPKISDVTAEQVMDNYFQVKLDIQMLVEQEVYKLKNGEEGDE